MSVNKVVILFVVLAISACANLSQKDIENENRLTEIAIGNCEGEFEEGVDYKFVEVSESDLVDVQFIKQDLKFRVSKQEWKKKQAVNETDILVNNENFNKCRERELAYLRSTYLKPSQYGTIAIGIVALGGLVAVLAGGGGGGEGDGIMQADGGDTTPTPNLVLTVPTP